MVGERPFLEIGEIDSCRVSQARVSLRQPLPLFLKQTCLRETTMRGYEFLPEVATVQLAFIFSNDCGHNISK